MIKIVKVTGYSLAPDYNEGDFLLISKIPFHINGLKEGDHIVFEHDIYGRMVKKISQIDRKQQKYFVLGNHPDSLDSRQLGWMNFNNIQGKVLLHIKPKRN